MKDSQSGPRSCDSSGQEIDPTQFLGHNCAPSFQDAPNQSSSQKPTDIRVCTRRASFSLPRWVICIATTKLFTTQSQMKDPPSGSSSRDSSGQEIDPTQFQSRVETKHFSET